MTRFICSNLLLLMALGRLSAQEIGQNPEIYCRDFIKSTKVAKDSEFICAEKSRVDFFYIKTNEDCFLKGLSSAQPGYFEHFKNSYLAKNQTAVYPFRVSPYARIIKECRENRPISEHKVFKVYQDFYYAPSRHDTTLFGEVPSIIGGISGVTYNASKSQLYAITDDAGKFGNPRIFTFELTLDKNSYYQLSPKRVNDLDLASFVTDLSTKVFDGEGIGLLNETSVLIASESEPTSATESFIKKFDLNGDYQGEIPLPAHYWTQTKPIKTEVIKEEIRHFSSNIRQKLPLKSPSILEKLYGLGPHHYRHQIINYHRTLKIPTIITVPYKWSGLHYNRGFESLSLTKNKKYLFTATEGPLRQDDPWWDGVNGAEWASELKPEYVKANIMGVNRILRLKKNNNGYSTPDEFFYPIDPTPNNGIVDILALSKNRLIVMERSFDAKTIINTVRLYKVKLSSCYKINKVTSLKESLNSKILKKELLLDLKDLEAAFAPGFQKVDNFEGITFGPKLPNGKQSLILATDDNFRFGQQTAIVILEYNDL